MRDDLMHVLRRKAAWPLRNKRVKVLENQFTGVVAVGDVGHRCLDDGKVTHGVDAIAGSAMFEICRAFAVDVVDDHVLHGASHGPHFQPCSLSLGGIVEFTADFDRTKGLQLQSRGIG